MRISRYRKFRPIIEPLFRANQQIRATEVRVIDEEGKLAGVLTISEALKLAEERGYDLVEVSPKENPPICRLLDYGQFKYQKEKETRKQKAHAHKVEVKGVRLSLRIGEHDLDIRRKKSIEFLKKGNKVQIEMILRGRERQHTDLAQKIMDDFAKSLNTDEIKTKTEQPFQRQGGRLTLTIARV